MPPKAAEANRKAAEASRKVAETPPQKVADLGVMNKSRYYEDFREWLECCKTYDPELIIGTPLETTMFRCFKKIFREINGILSDPQSVKGLEFENKRLKITVKSPLDWRYPRGNTLVYHPDDVIDRIYSKDD